MRNIDDKVDKSSDLDDIGNRALPLYSHTPSSHSISSNNDLNRSDIKDLENQRTIVIHGKENTVLIAETLLQKCNHRFDLYCSKIGPSHMIELYQYRKIYSELKNRNVKIKVITEITADNLEYCKQIIELFSGFKTSGGN